MQILCFAVLFVGLVWLVSIANGSRKFLTAALAGTMVLMLVGAPHPSRAQAPAGILVTIQAILSVINSVIQTTLTSIHVERTTLNNLQQLTVWPQSSIHQAQSQVTAIVGQYRTLMASISHVSLQSATLPVPQAFEAVARDHHVNNFSSLTTAYSNAYGLIPFATDANGSDRAMSDADDALALDSIKLLKATDQAADIELQSADSIENSAAHAAPGSTPFLLVVATIASINGQALTQKMLAAELRQEAAQMAHRNTLRKDNANNTAQLRRILVNLLEHQ